MGRGGKLCCSVYCHSLLAVGFAWPGEAPLGQDAMGAYLISLGVLICINGILAVTLNFIMGYAGIYSMAHGVLYGVSAYAAALIALHVAPSFELAVAAAMIATTTVSVMVAGPAIRVRGEYFVAASLGLQMVA